MSVPVKQRKYETAAELFISNVEKLPNVDKYVAFHEDVRKNNKAVAVELSIRLNNRITLYQFHDKSMLELSETWANNGAEEINFKAI